MDALTAGSGDDEITKEQFVFMLTNHVGHGITSSEKENDSQMPNRPGSGRSGRPGSAISSGTATTSMEEFPEGYLGGRFGDERYPYAKEDPHRGRPGSARDRTKSGIHSEPPRRVRTSAGTKEIMTTVRDKVR